MNILSNIDFGIWFQYLAAQREWVCLRWRWFQWFSTDLALHIHLGFDSMVATWNTIYGKKAKKTITTHTHIFIRLSVDRKIEKKEQKFKLFLRKRKKKRRNSNESWASDFHDKRSNYVLEADSYPSGVFWCRYFAYCSSFMHLMVGEIRKKTHGITPSPHKIHKTFIEESARNKEKKSSGDSDDDDDGDEERRAAKKRFAWEWMRRIRHDVNVRKERRIVRTKGPETPIEQSEYIMEEQTHERVNNQFIT